MNGFADEPRAWREAREAMQQPQSDLAALLAKPIITPKSRAVEVPPAAQAEPAPAVAHDVCLICHMGGMPIAVSKACPCLTRTAVQA